MNHSIPYGIGTILDIDGRKHMVSGYRLVEEDGFVGLAYVMLPYPLGFVSEGDFSLLSTHSAVELIAPGYVGNDQDSLLLMLEKVQEEGAKTPFSQYAAAMKGLYGGGETGGVDRG